QPYPLPRDQCLTASYQAWVHEEPAVAPGRWVLFHPEQYAQPGFPFAPFTPATVCQWGCFRQAFSGTPWWGPEGLADLFSRPRFSAPDLPLDLHGFGLWPGR